MEVSSAMVFSLSSARFIGVPLVKSVC